jgi:tetraacyldisaccharide 4'-kinase
MLKYILLKLLSVIYGIVVSIRNEMFNLRLLSSKEFDIPIISVGNITVGGTGKTPHTEYVAELLKKNFRVAVLSRGYKRKSWGYRLVETSSKTREVGDEPLQIKLKFSELIVAVDANRVRGIKHLIALPEKPAVIILDDAFQHQYVSPGINILLTDYNRLITHDSLLPYGRLRESATNKSRATIIIVTKCPPEIKPIDERIITKDLEIRPYQNLYFTRINYGPLVPVFPQEVVIPVLELSESTGILLVTGIANPAPLKEHLLLGSHTIETMKFKDHHQFTAKDIERIRTKFDTIATTQKIIITTEKDMVRFRDLTSIPEIIRQNIYYVPVKVSFLNNAGNEFDRKILSYVKENKGNFNFYSTKNWA